MSRAPGDASDGAGGDGPPRTEDGHFVVVDGRRWRATDPSIPEALRAELVATLMAARRAVRGGAPRDAVQDAKVALGERGEPWWEEPTSDGRRERLAATIRSLLRHRAPEATICPSDAARAVGGAAWRALVPEAREVAAQLRADGIVRTTQRGEDVDPRQARGPIRIGRGTRWGNGTQRAT